MIPFEEIKRYLPQYLSAESQKELFSELKSFPENIDQRLYISSDSVNTIFQGDGFTDLLIINLPSSEIKPVPAMILSNTCDISPLTKRFLSIRLVYAPIIQYEKYRRMLLVNEKVKHSNIYNHLESIKKQYVSNIIYLPKGKRLKYDAIVLLDRLTNCSAEIITKEMVEKRRLFTLSNYGFYLFLIKISIHFTRVREGVDRGDWHSV